MAATFASMSRQSWAQSRQLTDQSWAVVNGHRYLLVFPILGFVLTLIPVAALWLPAALLIAGDQFIAGVGLIILGMFGTAMAVSLTAGGLVAATDQELRGTGASIGKGLGAAFGRLFALLGWAVIQLIVSIITSLIRGNGQGGVGDVVRNIAAAGILAMWQIITFFVLPFIMLDSAGPIQAVKRSSALVKKRWGLQIFGGVRIGGRVALFTFLPAFLIVAGGIYLLVIDLIPAGVAVMVLGVLLFAIGALLLSTLRGVFSVVLFRYANDGEVLGGFDDASLANAVRTTR